jgi:hypothetical protein
MFARLQAIPCGTPLRSQAARAQRLAGRAPKISPSLKRVPITWNHVIDKESLKIKILEQARIEKVCQRFRNLLEHCAGKTRRHDGLAASVTPRSCAAARLVQFTTFSQQADEAHALSGWYQITI